MVDNTSTPTSRQTGLLCLPYELRLQIYRYCIPTGVVYEVSHLLFWGPNLALTLHDNTSASSDATDAASHAADPGPSDLDLDPLPTLPTALGRIRRSVLPSLLQVSRQVSEEALHVLYSGNVFKIMLHGDGQYDFGSIIPDSNRQRIRHVMLVMRPGGISFRPNFRMSTEVWDPTLPHLSRLTIVAEEPSGPDHHFRDSYNSEGLEKQRRSWFEWLERIHEFLSKRVPNEISLLVDIENGVETGELIKNYLPHDYRKTRTMTGDFMFKRGRFSIASGYWNEDVDDLINCRDICDYDSD